MEQNMTKSNFGCLERLWVHIWLIKTLYYKMWQKFITKCIRFITKCDSFYKIRGLLQNASVYLFKGQNYDKYDKESCF